MIRYTLLTLCVITLTACSSTGKISDIDVGMSKQEIVAKMGTPDKSWHDGEMEVLTYLNKKEKIWSMDKHDYRVVLINNTTAQIDPENGNNAG